LFNTEFAAQVKVYMGSMQALLDHHRQTIDGASKTIAAEAQRDVIGLYVAGGDLSPRTALAGGDEVAALMRSLVAMTDNLRGTVQQVRNSADSIMIAS